MVLGHVDAGKSTLMGRLLADLGLVPPKTLHRHAHDAAAAGKASFSWAWVLDERCAPCFYGFFKDHIHLKTEKSQRIITRRYIALAWPMVEAGSTP